MKVIFKYLIDHISVVNLHICNWTYHYSIASRSCTGCTYCRVRSHICIYSIYSQFIVFFRCTHIFIFTLSRTYLYSRIHALICIHAFTRLFLFPLSCTYLSSAFTRLFVSKHLSLRFQALSWIHSLTRSHIYLLHSCAYLYSRIHTLIYLYAFTHLFCLSRSRTCLYSRIHTLTVFIFMLSRTYLFAFRPCLSQRI